MQIYRFVGAIGRMSPVDIDGIRVMELQWIEDGEVRVELVDVPYLGDGQRARENSRDAWASLNDKVLS